VGTVIGIGHDARYRFKLGDRVGVVHVLGGNVPVSCDITAPVIGEISATPRNFSWGGGGGGGGGGDPKKKGGGKYTRERWIMPN
jgi:hypothetical protein